MEGIAIINKKMNKMIEQIINQNINKNKNQIMNDGISQNINKIINRNINKNKLWDKLQNIEIIFILVIKYIGRKYIILSSKHRSVNSKY